MGKGNEELKAKIAKIQSKGKAPAVPPVPAVTEKEADEVAQEAEDDAEDDMEALERDFEAKKKALMNKAKEKTPAPAQEPEAEEEPVEEDPEAGIESAIAEYSDEGKFRVEVIYQLVGLNKSLKEISEALRGLVSNGN